MSGHVFITQGDLTRLTCDAWLLPIDEDLRVTRGWLEGASPEVAEYIQQLQSGASALPERWSADAARVVTPDNWPVSMQSPQPYLVNVGADRPRALEWYLEGVRQFVSAAKETIEQGGFASRRAKPLLALPLVGTGQGGVSDIKGEVVHALLRELYAIAGREDLDLVLVTSSPAAFESAQQARKRCQDDTVNGQTIVCWGDLNPELTAAADELARHAASGQLVLFLGAGVSVGAGLPTWAELLHQLSEQVGLTDEVCGALTSLPNLDQARIIAGRLQAQGRTLGEAIAGLLEKRCSSLTHTLLAGLPTDEIATMNYDRLFEIASEGAGRPAAVLPYAPVAGNGRWLLKMHGCITRPSDIVLTREDYIRYEDRRAALAGIVQALLITRHMLFVGFSLTDDNFHRITDEVRRAIRGDAQGDADTQHFGTALMLTRSQLMEELWTDDVRLVSMSEDPATPISEATRRLEIFLDFLLSQSTSSAAYLLDDDFVGILTPEERAIRDGLLKLQQLEPMCHGSPAWQPIRALLDSVGGARKGEVAPEAFSRPVPA